MDKVDTNQSGVVYLPTIPPYMDVRSSFLFNTVTLSQAAKLRHLLQPYARIGRIYLTEEDASKYANRVKSGGCKKISYTEGWVEFLDKHEAKSVAQTLNAKPIGGKKRHNFYRDDIWCMKYLSKFTWNDLMEHRVHSKEVGRKKLQVALMKQKKQDEEFVESLSQKRHFESIAKKRAAKGIDGDDSKKRRQRDDKCRTRSVYRGKPASVESLAAKESLLSALAL